MKRVAVAVMVASGVLASSAIGAAGDLDRGFGVGGKLLIGGAVRGAQGSDVVELANGTLVAGADLNDAAVWQLRADGSFDTLGFGDQGQALIPLPVQPSFVGKVRLVPQPGGGVITATGFNDPVTGTSTISLSRLLPSGGVDTSFGDGGVVPVDPPAAAVVRGAGVGLALSPDGRIVVSSANGDAGLFAARFLADGTPDESFSGDGVAVTPVDGGGDATAIAVAADGSIVLAGWAQGGYKRHRAALVRLLEDGSPDPSFGGDGIVAIRFGLGRRSASNIYAITLTASGGVVVVGDQSFQARTRKGEKRLREDAFVARLKPGGRLDRSFADFGVYKTRPTGDPQGESLDAVALRPSGRLLAGGSFEKKFLIIGLRANGRLDRGFSGDGRVSTGFGIGRPSVAALGLRADGSFTAVGTRTVTSGAGRSFQSDAAVARYLGR